MTECKKIDVVEWNAANINIHCIFRNEGVVSTDVALKMEKKLLG